MRISDWSSDVCSSDLLADVAQIVPGLTFSQTANDTPVYTLRGVGFFESTLAAYPDVSVYLDQVPLPFPTLTSLTAFDLDRLEVLKGPQGTLFGQNSTGGAINYIAAKPTSDLSAGGSLRSEEHTSELQSLMRISYAVFCLKKKKNRQKIHTYITIANKHNDIKNIV